MRFLSFSHERADQMRHLLGNYVASFGAQIIGLTGTNAQLVQIKRLIA